MSLYKASIDYGHVRDTKTNWVKFKDAENSYMMMAYSLNLTNVGVKTHKATPVEKDGYLEVSPYVEMYSPLAGYHTLFNASRKFFMCKYLR